MHALIFELKPFFFSYKNPIAYQVKTSNLLPPPSTLLSAMYKNYVKLVRCDYNERTLRDFLNKIRYVGLTVLPRDGDGVVIRTTSVLLRLWRVEKRSKEKRGSKKIELYSDAMVREYVFIHGRPIGVVVFDDVETSLVKDIIESIEYLGNSESLVSVRVVDDEPKITSDPRDAYATQIVASTMESLPEIGVVEQCGKLPETPWGSRSPSDVCYVWNPLEPVSTHVYRPLKYDDVEHRLRDRGLIVVNSERLKEKFVVVTNGFDCLKPSDVSSSASSRGGVRERKRR